MAPRVDAIDSLGRREWPWIVFGRDGHAVCRGVARVAAQLRAERAEGRWAHRQFLIVKNERTGEAWVRLGGSWHPRKNAA